ncbi:MAG TPA: hypothetical protein VKB88_37180 [Bryobacteraceae bacterium]|nr:hypothetical protein [Bryobacteraceae bacterium]
MEQSDNYDLRRVLREWQIADAPADLESRVMAARSASRPRLLLAAASVVLVAGAAMLSGVAVPTVKPFRASAPVLTLDRDGEGPFVPIPYVAPLDSYEIGRVVRVNVRVAQLMGAGFEVPLADPASVVVADVVVGDDGRAHALRLVSDSSVDGRGD